MEGNKEIPDYIKEQLQKGVPVQEIKSAFLEKGWKENVIDMYINEVVDSNSSEGNISPMQSAATDASQVQNISSNKGGGSLPGSVDLLKEAWVIYKNSWKTIIGIILLPILALVLLGIVGWLASSYIVHDASPSMMLFLMIGMFLLFLPLMILQFWGQLALLYSIVYGKDNIGIKESFRKSFKRIHSYFWLLTLSGFTVFGGSLLFIIPGIILSIFLVLDVYILAAEDIKGLSALIKSREYIRGHWWKVAGRLGFLVLIWFLITILVAVTEGAVGLLGGAEIVTILNIVIGIAFQVISSLVIMPLNIIYVFLIYSYLKDVKGSFDFSPPKGQRVKFVLLAIVGALLIPAIFVITIMIAINPTEQLSKARDSGRKQTQLSLEMALEFYYIENGIYPNTLNELVPGEIEKLPEDPKTGEIYYTYQILDNGKNYLLCVDFELQETECGGSGIRQPSNFQNIYKPNISPFVQYDPSNTNIQ